MSITRDQSSPSRTQGTCLMFERWHRIIALLSPVRPVRACKLAECLEVTTRTIDRDIDFLMYRLDLPISRTRQGIKLEKPIKLCPTCARQLTDE